MWLCWFSQNLAAESKKTHRLVQTMASRGLCMFFGNQVKGGFHGEHPSLSLLDQGDLIMTTDFRSVYASMIQEWMGVCRMWDPFLVVILRNFR